jgi:hypothetical protein
MAAGSDLGIGSLDYADIAPAGGGQNTISTVLYHPADPVDSPIIRL